MGIRHPVPSGLPTGRTAGKVAGDDWRDDHLHVPFEVAMFLTSAAAAPAAASAAAGVELFSTAKTTRNKIDLAQARFIRLVAAVVSNGNSTTAAIKVQYTTSEAATWAGTDAGASLVLGTGTAGITRDSGWQTLAAGAQVDNVVIAAVVSSAFGTTAPTIGSLTVFFK